MRLRYLCGLLAILSLMSSAVFAAERTGSISGVVRSQDGKPLPGVTVTISGPRINTRTDYTDSGGAFRFARLLPGQYLVKANLEGLGSWQRNVVVEVERDTQLEVALEARATAAVEVTAALPLVDTKSTEVANNFRTEEIRQLPLSRTYIGLFQLAPGVAENNASTGSPNAGGLRQDNAYYYDGVNATNPFFGDFNIINFSELDIDEVNIKRGGITAEFGRTGGFIVNAVTKSGTNSFHGEGRYLWTSPRFRSNNVDPTVASAPESKAQAVGLGGPVWADHAWFYGSLNRSRQTTTDRVNNLGTLPDSDFNTDEYFGKLTTNPTSQLFLAGSYRYKKDVSTNAGVGTLAAASTGSNGITKDTLGFANAVYNITPDFLVDFKFNRYSDKGASDPVVALAYQPKPFDVNNPCAMGSFRTTATKLCGGANATGQTAGASSTLINNQDFFRDEYRISTSLFRTWFGWTHDIRAGFGYDKNGENLLRQANGWGSITVGTTASVCPGTTAPCFRANYTPIQPLEESLGKTYSIYLQDQVTIADRLTVMLGVLANRDEYISSGNPVTGASGPTLLKFDFDKTLQPRVGVAYVFDAKVRDKAYVNYGRYYNLDNKSLARAASPYRIFSSDAIFNYTTGALISDIPRSSETGKVVLPGIKPTYTDEIVAGYARPLGGVWAAEVWGMYRTKHNFIEDFPTVNRDTSPSAYVYGNLDAAFERYKAVTLELTRAFRDRWAANVSYSWSRLEGNWDLDYANALFYSSSALEDGPGLFVEDPNRKGILSGDREHVVKVFGSYRLFTNTTLGGYLRYQSGAPYEGRGLDYVNVYRAYLEPAGSRRTPSWTNFDLLIAQAIPIGPVQVQVEFRVFNLFNQQTVLTVDNRMADARNPDGTLKNPLAGFEKPLTYAAPRRGSLSFGVTF